MNFIQSQFSSDTTEHLLKQLCGDKNLSQETYWRTIDELIKKSDSDDDVEVIMAYMIKKLNLKFEKWKKIYKTLKLLENLLKGGNMKIVYKMKYYKELIDTLSEFKYAVNGAENIREKAKKIYALLDNDDLLKEERKRYQLEREKELKEEIKREGGLLNSIGTYTFDRNNDKNKYDLTRRKEEDDDSDESEDEEKEKPPLYQKKEQKVNKTISTVNTNTNLISFDDIFSSPNANGNNQQTNINQNKDLVNMDEFLNPVQDNNVKLINLQLGLNQIQNQNQPQVQNNQQSQQTTYNLLEL